MLNKFYLKYFMKLKKFVILITMAILAIPAFSQVKASGVVIADGEPAIGATVQVKGQPSIGAATDIDGKFVFTVPNSNSVLVFSYLGFETKEVKASENMTIELSPAGAHELSEVVVTGMQKTDKRLFTGATTQINAEDAKLDGVADISRSLEGKSAGVSVQNVSGTFGTAPKIRVRGATSIYGASKPLWVVDGVVMEDAVEVSADELSSGDAVTLISSAIAGLNSDDIESFQILKDGSATSIYGAKAMAGVIVVTTKKGKAGSARVSYTGEFTTRMKPRYADFNISNSQEQMGIYREMEQKGWLEFASIASAANSGVYGKMYQMIEQYDATNGKFGLEHTPSAMNAYLRAAEYRNTDWFDELFSNALLQNHSVSIAGGTEKGKFYTSLSVMNDPGWYQSSDVRRYTFNANASYDISQTLRVSVLTSDSYRKQKAPGTLSQETDPVSGVVKRGFDINPYSYALNTSRTLSAHETYTRNWSDFNIFHELENNYIDIGVTDLKFQGEINWRPISGLEFNALGAYRYQSSVQEHHVKDHSNQALAYRAGIDPEDATIRAINPYLYTDPEDPNALPVTILPKGGIYYNDTYKVSQYDFRATGTYNKTWNNTHIFNIFAGLEINSTEREALSYTGWGFVYDNGGVPFVDYNWLKQLGEENGQYYSNTYSTSRSAAYFANATYSYNGRYVLNGTVRYEGTNKLGKSRDARWLPTWNVSAAWNAHEEDWFRNNIDLQKVLSHATLRLSYSLTADSGPAWVSNATPVYNPYRPWRPLSSVQELGLQLSDIANEELTYEKKKEFNVGFDLGFMQGSRINFSGDVYFRDNFDLIGTIYTQGVGGVTMKYANVAAMKSHGVEFTLSTRNIETKDFSWTTDLTFSKTKNEITDLDSRSNVMQLVSGSGYAKQGYPVRAIFSIPFVGLSDEGLPLVINEDGKVTSTDINFQEFEKTDFLKYEGPTDPTITGGFGNVLSWKNFRLNLFMTYSFGNKIRLDPVFAAAYDDLTAMPKEFKNRWVMPGDERYTTIPVIASRRLAKKYDYISRAYSAYNYSTERIADGGFIRLKEVSLTYDIPQSFLEKIRFSSASIKVQATNLWLIYSDKKLNGQDPEFFNAGGVATPSPKQFTFTLRFSL